VSAVDRFLERLQGVKPSDKGWEAKCPAHDDRHASLTVAEGDDGRVLVRCHAGAGCTFEEIVAAAGLKPGDLFERRDGSSGRRILATYDYEDAQGAMLFQAVRFEPKGFAQRRPDGRGGWVWKLGNTRRVLFRLPQVLEAVTAGRTIYAVEGEKDVLALEAAGEVATCNPMGAGKWRAQFAKTLRGADVVIVQDRDEEGRKHASVIVESLVGIAKSVRRVEAAEGKDAADHLAARRTVAEFVTVSDGGASESSEHLNAAAEAASLSQNDVQTADLKKSEPPELASEPDILEKFAHDLHLAGVAGEEQAAKLIYLGLTSRLLPWGKPTERPVSMIPKGTSSSGKSHTLRSTLRFFPPESYFDLGSMSKRYLLYSEESLEHRFIVVPEWATIAKDDEVVALLRTLLSEGHASHGTVDAEGGKREARLIEKKGPTGLLMTTTVASTDPELETRCLSFLTDDSREQTRRVFEVLADLEDEESSPVTFGRWHELQRWIAGEGEQRVLIPYVKALSQLMPNTTTRLRRDFVSMLCLVRAHAILHRATRKTDHRGRVVATIDDYGVVRELVSDLIAESVGASASPAIRATVEAVRKLLEDSTLEHVSVKQIADELEIGLTATYDRVRRALFAGYLVDVATKEERTKKIVVGAPLPGEEEFLPSADAVFRSFSDEASEDGNSLAERDLGAYSDVQIVQTDPSLNVNGDGSCGHSDVWLGRDGAWRCMACDPPAFPGEVVTEATA
jgi:5S rRNA maturation endonuclease (ribonuclease M5)